MNIKWKMLIIASVVIYLCSVVCGAVARFVTVMVGQSTSTYAILVGLSNTLCIIIGLTVIGRLASGRAWTHIAIGAVILWLTGLINVAFFGMSVAGWILSVIVIAIMAAIAGGISALIGVLKKQPKQEGETTA
jgi:hypothetical protein